VFTKDKELIQSL